jgi:hypothetical protein
MGKREMTVLFIQSLGCTGFFSGHFNISAQRNGGYAILGHSPFGFNDFRPKPQGKHLNPHATGPGGEEMTQFMDKNQYTDNNDKCKKGVPHIEFPKVCYTRL